MTKATLFQASVPFTSVRMGELFILHGNVYLKASTRTAVMVQNGRTFYIREHEHCTI